MESLLQLIEGPAGAFVMAISGLLWLVMLLIASPFLASERRGGGDSHAFSFLVSVRLYSR